MGRRDDRDIRRRFAGLGLITVLWPIATANASTYYVRTDGGTAQQCTGFADSAYPGTGNGQACAWSHPFWALDAEGGWRIRGGDTIIIRGGMYVLGYGAPNSGWCEPDGAFACVLPPLPSGPSPQQPTRILGAGYSSGCATAPQLWGTQRADTLINLSKTSNAVLDCLELTDHSGCVEGHHERSVRCQRDTYPFGEWAAIGIYAADSANVTLRNLNIHGLAVTGVQAGRLTDWTVENVRLAANGMAGWDGDIDGGDSNSGVMRFKRWVVEWNGCAETYPGGRPSHCWAQSAGGYGDGVGTGATGGQWIIEDSVIRYNTSDGLDLLYAGRAPGSPSSVSFVRSIAIGNAGNQVKTGGPASIVNSLLVSNCGFFHNKSFGAALGPREGDHCRAGGAAAHLDLHGNAAATLVNSTVAGHGDVLVSTECQWRPCSGSERLSLINNVFLGAPEFMDPQDRTALLWDPSGLASGRVDYNVIHAVKIDRCPVGANDNCGDPRFLNPAFETFDGHLQAASPAVDSGLAVGAAGNLVPADDLEGNPRPSGAGVDRGAYERPSGQPRGGPPSVRSVAEAAGFRPVIASGSWFSIFGSDLSTITRTWNWLDMVDNKLPKTLAGVRVTVDGREAAVYFVSPGQINALAPAETRTGPVSVTVTNSYGSSASVVVDCQAVAPGFFMFDPEGRRYVAGVHADGVFVGRTGLFGGAATTRPARPGDRIMLFGTGFGPTNPRVPADEVFQGAAPLAETGRLTIRIGGAAAVVEFAGIVGAGLYQFNVVIPNVPAGDREVVAQIGEATSQSSAFITIGAP